MSNRRNDTLQATPKTTGMAGQARRALAAIALAAGVAGTAGCAPRVFAANVIQPSEPGDTKEVWIYLHTNDADVDGVYRCYDGDQKPVCKRATLVTK